MSKHAGRSILIIDQGFLKSRHGKPVHGVELFRLNLIRQMLERDVDVTLACVSAWTKPLRDFFGDNPPKLLYVSNTGVPSASVLSVIRAKLSHRSLDTVMFGNIGRATMFAVNLARVMRLGRHRFAMAHRPPKPKGGRIVATCPLPIVAVSEHVAGPFRDAGDPNRVHIMYGLANAENFSPRTAGHPDAPCRFVLLAKLPHVIKGEGTAIRAFELLPDELRGRCELHLIAYSSDPPPLPSGVTAHRWTPPAEVPDLLRSMDVMLALSSIETFSQAIVQGMLSGLPVIATPLPVYIEKLDSGGGIIVGKSAEESEELAIAVSSAMRELAVDSERRARMGAIGRQTALERYAWNTDEFLNRFAFPESVFTNEP